MAFRYDPELEVILAPLAEAAAQRNPPGERGWKDVREEGEFGLAMLRDTFSYLVWNAGARRRGPTAVPDDGESEFNEVFFSAPPRRAVRATPVLRGPSGR
jgi:hypothetical protein